MQEQFLLKQTFTTGTTIAFFDTQVNIPSVELYPAYVTLDIFNVPQAIFTFNGSTLWSLDNRNIYVPLSSVTTNFVTGNTFFQTFNNQLSQTEKDKIQSRFANSMFIASSGLSQSYVFFNDILVDDLFIDLKLTRTSDTLDTLNILNTLTNSIPTQEAKTGILFGKLEAIQKLKDVNGNKIRIPLKNVPIGIFNASPDFPSPTSVDVNGDRIILNLKESAQQLEYFNFDSFSADTETFLRSGSQFTTVPSQYKFITKTNDNGEYVIYNAPVGSQILVFEIDLLKQGLTKDEVALNFFPYPADENANVDNIPNFFFRQIPANVIPAWGTAQSGYTELNVSVNLDLRKWTTYIFPPVAFGGQKLEQAVAGNSSRTFKIQFRDMTLPGFPLKSLETVQVVNDLSREPGAQFLWQNEFAVNEIKAEFDKFGCNIVKLPANLYDSNAFRTDTDGIPTTGNSLSQGVWLSSYQFKVFVDNTVASRATGAFQTFDAHGNQFNFNHFDLNFTNNNVSNFSLTSSVGQFPYEIPWSLSYPNQYNIARKPQQQRFLYRNSTNHQYSPGVFFVEEPAYSDGDLTGVEVFTPSGPQGGGFSVQFFAGAWFPNRIGYVATRNFMYKYEINVSYDEEYSNGYQPFWNSSTGYPLGLPLAGLSKVNNGEQFQRVECGYGYFMKPQGWPRIVRYSWGADAAFTIDTTPGTGMSNADPNNPGPGISNPVTNGNLHSSFKHFNDVYNLDNQNLTLCLDNKSTISNGKIDIFRIVDSGINNIIVPAAFVIPTSIKLSCKHDASRCFSWSLTNTGNVDAFITNSWANVTGLGGLKIQDFNTGNLIPFPHGASIKLKVGYSIIASSNSSIAATAIQYSSVSLPGNASFNTLTNKYDTASYRFEVTMTKPIDSGSGHYSVPFNFGANVTSPEWFIRTETGGGAHGVVNNGLNTNFSDSSHQGIDNVIIEQVATGTGYYI